MMHADEGQKRVVLMFVRRLASIRGEGGKNVTSSMLLCVVPEFFL
jgi:hypothetical protein